MESALAFHEVGVDGIREQKETNNKQGEENKGNLENKVEESTSSNDSKIDFKVDKNGTIHVAIGKVSFSSDKIYQNAKEVLDNIVKIKPSSSKGIYMKSIFMSSTMSPGIKIDTNSF